MKKWRATYVSFTYKKDRMATDGRASPYKNRNYHMKTKGAPIIISVEINGKLRRKKRAHILNQARAHTFLTLCPIFGISQISKITHLVSGRGNPTKKPRLPSLKNLHRHSPRPTHPSTASYIPTPTSG